VAWRLIASSLRRQIPSLAMCLTTLCWFQAPTESQRDGQAITSTGGRQAGLQEIPSGETGGRPQLLWLPSAWCLVSCRVADKLQQLHSRFGPFRLFSETRAPCLLCQQKKISTSSTTLRLSACKELSVAQHRFLVAERSCLFCKGDKALTPLFPPYPQRKKSQYRWDVFLV